MIDQLHAFPVDATWTHDTTRVFVPIVAALVCFVAYWFTSISPQFKARFQRAHEGDEAVTRHIFAVKFTGFVTMGLVPLAVCRAFIPEMALADYGLTVIAETSLYSLAWTVDTCTRRLFVLWKLLPQCLQRTRSNFRGDAVDVGLHRT